MIETTSFEFTFSFIWDAFEIRNDFFFAELDRVCLPRVPEDQDLNRRYVVQNLLPQQLSGTERRQIEGSAQVKLLLELLFHKFVVESVRNQHQQAVVAGFLVDLSDVVGILLLDLLDGLQHTRPVKSPWLCTPE